MNRKKNREYFLAIFFCPHAPLQTMFILGSRGSESVYEQVSVSSG